MKNSTFTLAILASLITLMTAFGCKEKFETVPFEATFFTDLVSIGPDSVNCPDPYGFLNVQEGNGSETNIGTFTTKITFCVNPMTIEYINGEGTFTDAEGDELYITISGQVKPTTVPDYDLEFKDPFTITGGTGRFEGASGDGTTNSLVNQTTGRTDHVWNGMITMKK